MQTVWSAPVRYVECDQQGVVFNAHYLTWADEACTAFFAARGTPYADLLARGLDTVVKASSLTWTAPARYGDVVEVACGLDRVGRTSFALRLPVRVRGEQVCEVVTTYVVVGRGGASDGRPVPLPEDLRAAWS